MLQMISAYDEEETEKINMLPLAQEAMNRSSWQKILTNRCSDFLYYNDTNNDVSAVTKWSPKNPLLLCQRSNREDTYHDTGHIVNKHSMYVLNKQQVIKQKIDACERPPIQMIWDHVKTNSVIKFSAASFEPRTQHLFAKK